MEASTYMDCQQAYETIISTISEGCDFVMSEIDPEDFAGTHIRFLDICPITCDACESNYLGIVFYQYDL